MLSYKVHNPLTGQHTSFPDDMAARAEMVKICNAILQLHKPTLVACMTAENGDQTMRSVDISPPIVAS